MTTKQYYTTPPQEVFDEIKEASLKIWRTYDDTYGYASKKIEVVESLTNESDNAWFMVGMFDPINRMKLLSLVSNETAQMIHDAISMEG